VNLKQQAFLLLAAVAAVHLGVLTYATVGCTQKQLANGMQQIEACSNLGQTWTRTTESYITVILALLVPTTLDREG